MVRLLTASVLALVMSFSFLANVGHAQPPQAVAKLTEVQMHDYLKKLDPNTKVTPHQDAGGKTIATSYDFAMERNGTRIPIRMDMQANVIFMAVTLDRVADDKGLSQETLFKMVRANTNIGPTYFNVVPINEGGFAVRLSHRIDREASTNRLTSALDEFVGDIMSTKSIWSNMK